MATVRKGYERRQSTGDILLPVPADVAPFEQTNRASQAYTVGSFFYYNNTLYKVTSAISSGGTISPGSNCTATTVAAELKGGGSGGNFIDGSTSYATKSVSAGGTYTTTSDCVIYAVRSASTSGEVRLTNSSGVYLLRVESSPAYLGSFKSGTKIYCAVATTLTVFTP